MRDEVHEQCNSEYERDNGYYRYQGQGEPKDTSVAGRRHGQRPTRGHSGSPHDPIPRERCYVRSLHVPPLYSLRGHSQTARACVDRDSTRGSTIYWPDDLRSSLALAAHEEGRTEADLIREGLCGFHSREREPRLPLFASGQPDRAADTEEILAGFGER